jgi:signal transduction histidine kinase
MSEDDQVLAGQTIEEIRELSLQKANDWLTMKQPIRSQSGVITHLLGETAPLFPGRLGDILDKLPQSISVKKYYPNEIGCPGEFKVVWANRSFLNIHNRTDLADVIGKTDSDLWPGDPEQVEQFRRRDRLAVETYRKVQDASDWDELSKELRWARVVKELSHPDQERRCWEFRETTRSRNQTRVLQTTKWVEEYCGTLFVVVVYSDVTKGDSEQRRYHEMTTHNLRGATSPNSLARSHLERVLEGVDNVDARIQAAIACLDDTAHAVELFLLHHLKLLKMDVKCSPTQLKDVVGFIENEGGKLQRNWRVPVIVGCEVPDAVVSCDLTLLRFVLNELLLNAVKAARRRIEELAELEQTPYNPLVKVRFDRADGCVECFVEDNGAASVDIAERDKLVDAFDAARINPFDPDSRSFGLSFCVVALRAQGGRVELSPPTNNGTSIKVVLPLVRHGDAI